MENVYLYVVMISELWINDGQLSLELVAVCKTLKYNHSYIFKSYIFSANISRSRYETVPSQFLRNAGFKFLSNALEIHKRTIQNFKKIGYT